MKVPEKLVPLFVGLLLVVAFLFGRAQGQNEVLRGGGSRPPALTGTAGQTGQQPGQTVPQTGDSGGAAGSPITQELWDKVIANPAAAKGSEDAPVTMVEFTDYQCPFCARHFTTTLPQIEKEYVETGKVRYLIRDLPLPIHPNAPAAALAARCAGDEGKYWEMHDTLYEKQVEWSSGNADELFAGYAGEVGLDSGAFASCMDSEKYKKEIDEDIALAQQVGASGTPAFVINGQLVIGAQPFTRFQQAIEPGL